MPRPLPCSSSRRNEDTLLNRCSPIELCPYWAEHPNPPSIGWAACFSATTHSFGLENMHHRIWTWDFVAYRLQSEFFSSVEDCFCISIFRVAKPSDCSLVFDAPEVGRNKSSVHPAGMKRVSARNSFNRHRVQHSIGPLRGEQFDIATRFKCSNQILQYPGL